MKIAPKALLAATALAGLLAVTACSSGSPAETLDNGDEKNLKIAVFNGWDEGIAASELWKQILTEKGYDVSLEMADVVPAYAGLSTNDYDMILDTWLPTTHASYMEKYEGKVEDLGAWNDEAVLTVAVNEDAPIDSLSELAENAELFGNRIIGIEPGAGLTKQVTENTIPGYGLEKMEFLTSSTPAMLAELKTATTRGENIAVTLWRPHWAYDAFPVKDLKDPEGTLGAAESIHSVGSLALKDKAPTVHGWISNFKMDGETLNSLENAMFGGDKVDDYAPIVKAWMDENKDYVEGLTK